MYVRPATERDVEQIRASSDAPYDKLPGPTECEEAITFVDDHGVPRMVMKAQKVAELYLLLDHKWSTPAMRWAMFSVAHQEMERRLSAKGYTVAYSFFADGVPNGYIRRLVALGWTRMVERCVRYAAGRG